MRILEPRAFAFYDVSGCIKSWGRRGVLLGGIVGFALGVAFVAIPFTSDVLTFGVLGTLAVAAVEGAVIAGAFAVGIAAFCGKGEPYSTRPDRIHSLTRPSAAPGRSSGNAVLDAEPSMAISAAISASSAAGLAPTQIAMSANTLAQSAESASQWLDTIDAWENGGTGP